MPDLHMHFNNMGFDTSMYASGWFLTLFTTTLPLDLTNRIMDVFLVEVNTTNHMEKKKSFWSLLSNKEGKFILFSI